MLIAGSEFQKSVFINVLVRLSPSYFFIAKLYGLLVSELKFNDLNKWLYSKNIVDKREI